MKSLGQTSHMKSAKITLGLVLTVLVSACAGDYEPTKVKEEKVRAVDGVKYISADIKKGNDPQSFNQYSYRLDSRSRLLLRYEGASEISDMTDDERSVILRITLKNAADLAAAKEQIEVCPLESNWMMGATWEKAHPYPKGQWRAPGGDISEMDCVKAIEIIEPEPVEPMHQDKPSELLWERESSVLSDKSESSQEAFFNKCAEQEQALCFDVTGWFQSYVVERHSNWGVAIVTQGNGRFEVYGDKSSRGPRIHWLESSTVWRYQPDPVLVQPQHYE